MPACLIDRTRVEFSGNVDLQSGQAPRRRSIAAADEGAGIKVTPPGVVDLTIAEAVQRVAGIEHGVVQKRDRGRVKHQRVPVVPSPPRLPDETLHGFRDGKGRRAGYDTI